MNSIFKQLYPIYKFLEDNPFHKEQFIKQLKEHKRKKEKDNKKEKDKKEGEEKDQETFDIMFHNKFFIKLVLARDLLNISNSLSCYMQSRCKFITEYMYYIDCLILYLYSEILSVKSGFTTLPTLEIFNFEAEKEAIAETIRKLAESLSERYFTIGKSIDKRIKRSFDIKIVDENLHLETKMNNDIEYLCNLWFLPNSIINITWDWTELSIFIEANQLKELLNNETVMKSVNDRINRRLEKQLKEIQVQFCPPDNRVTLLDMIDFIEEDKFPILYSVMYKIVTINPSSVYPESVFSIISRCINENMTIDTAINKTFAKEYQKDDCERVFKEGVQKHDSSVSN